MEPLARLVSYGIGAVDPGMFGLGPIPAVRQALERASWTIADVDRIEINEAFAAIVIAVMRELGLPEDVVNVEGGGFAQGHPIGAIGAILTTLLVRSMRRDGIKRGVVTLCIGDGQGIALALEALIQPTYAGGKKMGRVQGKVAIVTGGRKGLGKASAILLANEGAKVVITDRKADGAEDVLEEIKKGGGEAIFIQQDVSKEEDWQRVIKETVDRFGKVNILVNNAGVGAGKNIEDITLEDWRWVMSINLDGVFLGTKYAVEAMKKSGGGSIINMSSIEGMVGDSRMVAYDSSKGGLRTLTKSAALHCAKRGYNIRINTVHPGFIDTDMVRGFLKAQAKNGDVDAARKALESLHPVGHLGEPGDVAYAVLYLASDESKFATGSELVIDGGYTAQ